MSFNDNKENIVVSHNHSEEQNKAHNRNKGDAESKVFRVLCDQYFSIAQPKLIDVVFDGKVIHSIDKNILQSNRKSVMYDKLSAEMADGLWRINVSEFLNEKVYTRGAVKVVFAALSAGTSDLVKFALESESISAQDLLVCPLLVCVLSLDVSIAHEALSVMKSLDLVNDFNFEFVLKLLPVVNSFVKKPIGETESLVGNASNENNDSVINDLYTFLLAIIAHAVVYTPNVGESLFDNDSLTTSDLKKMLAAVPITEEKFHIIQWSVGCYIEPSSSSRSLKTCLEVINIFNRIFQNEKGDDVSSIREILYSYTLFLLLSSWQPLDQEFCDELSLMDFTEVENILQHRPCDGVHLDKPCLLMKLQLIQMWIMNVDRQQCLNSIQNIRSVLLTDVFFKRIPNASASYPLTTGIEDYYLWTMKSSTLQLIREVNLEEEITDVVARVHSEMTGKEIVKLSFSLLEQK